MDRCVLLTSTPEWIITGSVFSKIFTKDTLYMGCLLWIKILIYNLLQSLPWGMQYEVIMDFVITALNYNMGGGKLLFPKTFQCINAQLPNAYQISGIFSSVVWLYTIPYGCFLLFLVLQFLLSVPLYVCMIIPHTQQSCLVEGGKFVSPHLSIRSCKTPLL